jgi:hypothetical protein
MDGHRVPASSNSKIRCSLENFILDAERWLAALYWCVRTSYGDDAAHAAADCWLRVFEEQVEGSSDLPELTRITAAAIALFVSRLGLSGQSAHATSSLGLPGGLVTKNAEVSRKAVGLQKWATNRDSEVAGLLADESVATKAASLHASFNRQE